MHEYSIISSLVERVDAAAPRGAQIRRVHVRIGELSGVDVPLLVTAFGVFRERTSCAAAELVVDAVAARWSCPRCGEAVPLGGPLRCRVCGAPARLAQGDEIILQRIEMEVPDV